MKSVAIYLRISKEEKDKDLFENESIKNQEKMLLEEINKHDDWVLFQKFVDEDLSGAGTYRPSFEKMIQECKNGNIDIVLCKSQSRFSRDLEVIEKYLHNLFPIWKVRFISIVDYADTDIESNKKSRQINALINEWYLEDLSINIKSTLKSKWRNGECTFPFVRYGFIKDKSNKNNILVDKKVLPIIRKMYELLKEGCSCKDIALIFNNLKIPSPYEYMISNNINLKLPNCSCEKSNRELYGYKNYIVRFSYKSKSKSKYLIHSFRSCKDNSISSFNFSIISISNGIQVYYNRRNSENDTIFYRTKENKLYQNIQSIYVYFTCDDDLKGLSLNVTFNFPGSFYLATQLPYDINMTVLTRNKSFWNEKYIHSLLKDPLLMGNIYQGKCKRLSYKNKKVVRNNKKDWIKVNNYVEPIFSTHEWNEIQDILDNKKYFSKYKNNMFYSKIFCMSCRNKLIKNTTNNKIYYLCSNKNCNSKGIDYSIIYNVLKREIKKRFKRNISATFLDIDKYLDKMFVYYDINDLKINYLWKI